MKAKRNPILTNALGHVTEHEYLGVEQRGHGIHCKYIPVFGCTETGMVRQYGLLSSKQDVIELYGEFELYDEPERPLAA